MIGFPTWLEHLQDLSLAKIIGNQLDGDFFASGSTGSTELARVSENDDAHRVNFVDRKPEDSETISLSDLSDDDMMTGMMG